MQLLLVDLLLRGQVGFERFNLGLVLDFTAKNVCNVFKFKIAPVALHLDISNHLTALSGVRQDLHELRFKNLGPDVVEGRQLIEVLWTHMECDAFFKQEAIWDLTLGQTLEVVNQPKLWVYFLALPHLLKSAKQLPSILRELNRAYQNPGADLSTVRDDIDRLLLRALKVYLRDN